jgi:spermidine/putrescine transport system substrate-binding protein
MNWKQPLSQIGTLIGILLASASPALADGELNIFNWGNYTSPDVIKRFEENYKVKVTITDYDSNDTALAKIRAGGHGFDIAVPSGNFLHIWISEGLVQETGAAAMENFKNIRKDFIDVPFDPGRKYSIPYMWGTFGNVVNAKHYSGAIDSWDLLFNPPDELKGKINVVPEMNDIIFVAIAYHGGKMCDGDKELLKKVRDTLKAAKPNWMSMEYSTIEPMVKGDMWATGDWNGSALRQRLQNPDIKYAIPREGSFIWQDTVVLLKDAKNVDNAKLFLNFIMDPENAALTSAFTRYANAIEGSEPFMPEDMKGAPELSIPDAVKDKMSFSIGCPADVAELYTKIWTDVLK